jgi:hypothetical protein
MGYEPLKPDGTNEEFSYHKGVWEKTYGPSARRNNSSTVRVSRTVKGEFLRAAPASTGGGKSALYKITSIFSDDYIGARKWNPLIDNGDGTFGDVQGSEVEVAKYLTGRMPDAESIDGNLITYEYEDDNLRKAISIGFSDEWQVMHPRYSDEEASPDEGILVPPGLIYVSRIQNGTGVKNIDGRELYLAEAAPARFWARQYDQSGP